MKYIYIGKIVNTHALKGEVRLISNFEFKEKVFIPGNTLYMGHYKTPEKIETYRKFRKFWRKNYEEVCLFRLWLRSHRR